MKISSYDISINSSRDYHNKTESEAVVRRLFFNEADSKGNFTFDKVDISNEARKRFFNRTSYKSEARTLIKNIDLSQVSPLENSDKNLIKEIVSKSSNLKIDTTEESGNIESSKIPGPESGRLSQTLGSGSLMVSFSHSRKMEINERTVVDSAGLVTTEDGREINFGLHLEMEREFSSEVSGESTVVLNKLIDPLVIQLDSGPPSLSDKVFSFDLNSDGENEEIRSLGKGSGFLALDINNDGKINDGSELFGTRSGNGFKDLAKYDDDNNGWIDENDEIFSKLSVWRPETDGEEEYMSGLLSADVGAIYLGYGNSEHSITDEKGNTLANLRSTGVYLKNSGEASQVYQLDMADLKEDKVMEPQVHKDTVILNNSQSPVSLKDSLRKQLEKFKESFGSAESSKSDDIYDDLLEMIRDRIDQLLELLGGDKKEAENE